MKRGQMRGTSKTKQISKPTPHVDWKPISVQVESQQRQNKWTQATRTRQAGVADTREHAQKHIEGNLSWEAASFRSLDISFFPFEGLANASCARAAASKPLKAQSICRQSSTSSAQAMVFPATLRSTLSGKRATHVILRNIFATSHSTRLKLIDMV